MSKSPVPTRWFSRKPVFAENKMRGWRGGRAPEEASLSTGISENEVLI